MSLRHASADYSLGTNERPVQQALADHLRAGDVVVDVGCNVGFYSLLAARLVGPSGRVEAFEPVAECAAVARANARRNGFDNISVHAVAAANAEGSVELLKARHPGGATISVQDLPHDFIGSVVVPSVTLDALAQRGQLSKPDFVKIDVEGAELQVLEGMEDLLDSAHPIVLCEVDDADLSAAESKAHAVTSKLVDHGYVVRQLELSYVGARSHVYHILALPVDRQ